MAATKERKTTKQTKDTVASENEAADVLLLQLNESENVSQQARIWTPNKDQAAILLGEDLLTDKEICKQLRINQSTLSRWKNDPEFSERVREEAAAIRQKALKLPIARKENRVRKLNDLAARMEEAMRLSAEEAANNPDAPAKAHTGLYTPKHKMAAGGTVRIDWEFDNNLVREYKSTLEQAAKELGQHIEKAEISVDSITRSYVGVDVGDV